MRDAADAAELLFVRAGHRQPVQSRSRLPATTEDVPTACPATIDANEHPEHPASTLTASGNCLSEYAAAVVRDLDGHEQPEPAASDGRWRQVPAPLLRLESATND